MASYNILLLPGGESEKRRISSYHRLLRWLLRRHSLPTASSGRYALPVCSSAPGAQELCPSLCSATPLSETSSNWWKMLGMDRPSVALSSMISPVIGLCGLTPWPTLMWAQMSPKTIRTINWWTSPEANDFKFVVERCRWSVISSIIRDSLLLRGRRAKPQGPPTMARSIKVSKWVVTVMPLAN